MVFRWANFSSPLHCKQLCSIEACIVTYMNYTCFGVWSSRYFRIIAFLSAMQVIVSPIWVLEKVPDKDATSWHKAEVWHLVCHRERKHGTCSPPYTQYLAADKLFDRRHEEQQNRIGRKWGTDRYMKNCNGDVSSLGWKSCLSYDEHHQIVGTSLST